MDELLGWGIFWTSFLISKYEYLVSYPKYICCLFFANATEAIISGSLTVLLFYGCFTRTWPPEKKSFKSINERSCLGDSTTTGLRLGSTQMFSCSGLWHFIALASYLLSTAPELTRRHVRKKLPCFYICHKIGAQK